jgi:heptosyltransferase-2
MATQIGIVRLSSLGDIVLTGPALRGLRSAFPDAVLSFITTTPYREVANLLPEVDEVIALERRGDAFRLDLQQLAGREWHAAADLQGSRRSRWVTQAMHTPKVLRYTPPRVRRAALIYLRLKLGTFDPVPLRYVQALESWGVEDDEAGLTLQVPEDALAEVLTRYRWLEEAPLVLVPGSLHDTKRWPAGYWAALALQEAQRRPVAIVGLHGDAPVELLEAARARENIHDLTGDLRIPGLIAVLSQAGAVVSGDTGPMHLAVAVNAPLVAIFGPTVKEFGFFPFRAHRVQVLQQGLWCRPCTPHGSARCPLGHHRCMRDTTVEDVLAALTKL